MNITRENFGNVDAVIKILIEKSDYEKTVEETLKDYRHKSSLPGFRPGKAPIGIIKKRFGKAILADEINKMLSQNLTQYLMEQKLRILGEPLSSPGHQKPVNWDTDENYEFAFDVALAPEFEVKLDETDKAEYYSIKVSDEMIDQEAEMISSQMGQSVDVEEIKEDSLVRGNFEETDSNGQIAENGIKADGVLLSVRLIKDEDIKKQFIGKKKEQIITFDPVAAYQNRHEVGHLLKISHEQADNLNSSFNFTVKEIKQFEKAELNEELFKKIYGEDTGIKTEELFREKLREEISANLKQASDRRFATEIRNILIQKLNFDLPEAFLKRWLKESNKELTEDKIDKDFNGFLTDLRWQLIKDEIVRKNELKVEEAEAFNFAKMLANAQYSQYGIYNAPEEQLESFAKMIMEKPEEKERIYGKLLEDKAVEAIKDKITINKIEVTREEFEKSAD